MTQIKTDWAVTAPTIFFGLLVFLVVILAAGLRLTPISVPQRYIFDEDYFAFSAALISHNQVTAYEYWHPAFVELTSPYLYRPPAVEWLHPPVAKLLMATAIQLVGNNPTGWRLAPALSGIALVLVTMYLSLRLFPHQKSVALLTGVLVATDHLLVVESRLAGANMVLSLLTTATVLSTHALGQMLVKPQLKHLPWRFIIALGLVAGLAVATKWSAVFIVFGCFLWLIRHVHQATRGPNLRLLIRVVSALVVIPIIVYILSYGQFFWLTKFDLKAWWRLQSAMWTYQTTTGEQHDFQSRPWRWPLNQVAIPYFLPTATHPDQPAIWASSQFLPISSLTLILSLGLIYLAKKNNKWSTSEGLLMTVILGFWLPWFFIPRNLFLYHFIPALPLLFILLSRRLIDLSWWLADTLKRIKN